MNGLRAVVALVVGWLVLGLCGPARALPVADSSLVGWYDANDIDGNPLTANPASGTAVGTWVNKANPGTHNGAATGTTPTLQNNQMNGRPVIRFSGASGTGYNIGTFRTTDGPYHYFGVTAASSSQIGAAWQRIVSSYDGSGPPNNNDWMGSNWCRERPLANWATNGAANAYPPPYSSFVAQSTAASGKKMQGMRLGRDAYQSTTVNFTGDMSEVLLYTRQLNAAERIITDNFFLAKYNGTNAQTASTTSVPTPSVLPPVNDVYSGDDPAQGNYDFDVFGVGQQVGAANQLLTSATSTNPIFANAGLILEATGGLGDNEYLLAGHKTAVNSGVTTDLPDAVLERWDRVWYLDFTGELDARVTFDFSEGGLTYSPPPGGTVFDLLYSPTNAFETTENPFTRVGLQTTVTDDQVSFLVPGGRLSDGYLTLAVAQVIPEPASLTLLAAGMVAAALRRRRAGTRRG
ncbi:MAG TPA: PEP-CTERM sorting domain-containing protein, partial [Planctomycetota bacterium]|nr:PEP-CTERM sorting domain-containing protein [Planctomycetota bacterium]